MDKDVLIVEKKEYVLIKRTINLSTFNRNKEGREILEKLSHSLENALVRSQDDMPDTVARLNSMVTVLSDDGGIETLRLVLPFEMATNKDNIVSLFSDKGVLLIGRREGQSFGLVTSTGVSVHAILKVRQHNKNIGLYMVL